jgi:hypothetical protein
VIAVENHERRPVLPRIASLLLAVHFDLMDGSIFMLDAIKRLSGVQALKDSLDVGEEQEVTIAEYDPAALDSKIRCQKPSKRKLRRGTYVVGASIEPKFTQHVLP